MSKLILELSATNQHKPILNDINKLKHNQITWNKFKQKYPEYIDGRVRNYSKKSSLLGGVRRAYNNGKKSSISYIKKEAKQIETTYKKPKPPKGGGVIPSKPPKPPKGGAAISPTLPLEQHIQTILKGQILSVKRNKMRFRMKYSNNPIELSMRIEDMLKDKRCLQKLNSILIIGEFTSPNGTKEYLGTSFYNFNPYIIGMIQSQIERWANQPLSMNDYGWIDYKGEYHTKHVGKLTGIKVVVK